jgi:tagaturonate reductase
MKKVSEVFENRNGKRPERVLQFGEGNFLRAFVDWMIDMANNEGLFDGSIVLCQPIPGGESIRRFINDQEGTYTLVMRGEGNGKSVEKTDVITSISRCINAYDDYQEMMKLANSEELRVIVSNTTEAGISYYAGDKLEDCPPSSFPAKITKFLYQRFKHFHGDTTKGLLFLPVELIDNNGGELRKIILQYSDDWGLEEDFKKWVDEANMITSTLVDRIVTGYPKENIQYFEDKLGYEDKVLDTSELFNLWVIEGKKEWKNILPVHKTNANVIWTDDVRPYKKRKVRILNGAHTSTVLAAWMAGYDIVRDFMHDEVFRTFMNQTIFNEVIPTIDLPREDLESFAVDVNDRFNNPYIDHQLLSIALNSVSKFNARCLSSMLDYIEIMNKLPSHLTFSLAALIKFYQGQMKDGKYIGTRADGTCHEIQDDSDVIHFFADIWKNNNVTDITKKVLGNTAFWGGRDLTQISGLEEKVCEYLNKMETTPVKDIICSFI